MGILVKGYILRPTTLIEMVLGGYCTPTTYNIRPKGQDKCDISTSVTS